MLRDAIEADEAIDTPDRAFALVSERAELVANYFGYAATGSAPPRRFESRRAGEIP